MSEEEEQVLLKKRRKTTQSEFERQGEQGASTSKTSSSVDAIGLAEGVNEELEVIQTCFRDLARFSSSGTATSSETQRAGSLESIRSKLGKSLRRLLEYNQQGRSGGDKRLDALLSDIFERLKACMTSLGEKIDLLKSLQLSFIKNHTQGPDEWKNLVSYAHKLSFTTFCPPNYVPGDPRWGVVGPFIQPPGCATGFFHFSPPAPQKWHVDASVLYDYSYNKSSERKSKSQEEAQEEALEPAAGETKEPETKVAENGLDDQTGGEKMEVDDKKIVEAPKEKKYLNSMVDFVLNPDLDFISESEEMSDSSD